MELQSQACSFVKKDTLAQLFSCEFCKIFKNSFFTEHLPETASEGNRIYSTLATLPLTLLCPDLILHLTFVLPQLFHALKCFFFLLEFFYPIKRVIYIFPTIPIVLIIRRIFWVLNSFAKKKNLLNAGGKNRVLTCIYFHIGQFSKRKQIIG